MPQPREAEQAPPWCHPAWLAGLLVGFASLLPIGYLLAHVSTMAVLPQLARPQTLQALANTLLLIGGVTLGSTLLGTSIAWLTVRTDLPGRRLLLIAHVLPLVIPSYLGAMIYRSALGIRFQGLLPAIGVLILFTYPYVLLCVRAGLLRLDPQLEDAARSLGRSRRQVLWTVTLPQLQRSIYAGALLAALYALSDFAAVHILDVRTLTERVYVMTLYRRFDAAAAFALLLVGITLLLVWLDPANRRGRRDARAPRSRGQIRPTALGPWKIPALLGLSGLLGMALIFPLAEIARWVFRGIAADEPLFASIRPITNSLLLSGSGALLAGVAALAVGGLMWRYPSRRSRLLNRSTYLSHAVPGVVIGFSFVVLSLAAGPWLYQTLPVLVFACAIHYLPQANGAIGAAFGQLHHHLHEASRTLGAGRLQTLRRVVLPLIMPGTLAGIALVFLTCMKELPMTLILGPIGFQTLATEIWSAYDEAMFARAALPALLLVGVSGLSLGLLLRRDS